jgi:hypothetical protein
MAQTSTPAKGGAWFTHQTEINQEVIDARGEYTDLEAHLNDKASAGHSHDAGGAVVLNIVASYANLGTGSTDGELKITADTGTLYHWDDTNSAWIPIVLKGLIGMHNYMNIQGGL